MILFLLFLSFSILTFGKDDLLLLCGLHLLHDNGFNLKRYKILEGEILSPRFAPELRRAETGASFSTAPRGAVRLDRNRPQIWPMLSSPPSRESGQRIWFKMECFRGGEKTSLQTQGKCQNKDGGKAVAVQLGGIQYKSRPHILSSFFSVSCSKAVEAWF